MNNFVFLLKKSGSPDAYWIGAPFFRGCNERKISLYVTLVQKIIDLPSSK